MTQPARGRAAPEPTSAGLGDGMHSHSQRFAATLFCVVLAAVTLLAAHSGAVTGPEVKPFLPIVGTIWALADLMTAFLLLAQFYVNGTAFFTVLAGAYAFSGLLTWPYLFAFPGLFNTSPLALAEQQVSVSIWTVWHATFPLVVALGSSLDPHFKVRSISRLVTRNAVWLSIAATICLAAAVTFVIFTQRGALPIIVRSGHFQPLFRQGIAPALALLNAIGCGLLLRSQRRMTTLQLWLVVALFTALLDCLLLATSPSRYSYAWYVGKCETVVTASVVLAILMSEVTGLYRRLAEMATIDMLTQLFNRRALEDHMRRVLGHARRKSSGLALLIVDIDFFKTYNDHYGHAQGDTCLRGIAALIEAAATRPLDIAARYGGEEFVVILPETERAGALAVAARILASVETAALPHVGSARGHVTVSTGVAYVANARDVDGDRLFEVADRALYQAKERGRNTFVLEEYVAASNVVALRPGETRKLFGT